jgi:hypothetical protein
MCIQQIELWTAVFRNLALVIGGLGTFCISIYGVSSWRREYIGKRDTDFCEEILELFYKAQEAIRWMRSPIVMSMEIPEKARNFENRSDTQEAKDNATVLFTRYQKEEDLFNKIHALRYRFKVRYGADASEPFEELHTVINKLFRSARSLERLWSKRPDHFQTDGQWKAHYEKIEEQEAIFWSSFSDSDDIERKMEEIVNKIENHCKKKIGN